jgi:phosphoribosylamine--glycine ligase
MGDKVLIVGGGGREHAIAWKLSQSAGVGNLIAAPGNAGISELGECFNIKEQEITKLAELAEKQGVDLTVVGPELPLSLGIVDLFESRGLPVFGPNKAATQLESSKIFAKDLMSAQKVPTGAHKVFDVYQEALEYVYDYGTPVVIKADGLAAGKGVTVAMEDEEACMAIKENLLKGRFGDSSRRVIIEEYLCGEEASVLALTDGKTILPMLASQDHKRIYDEDQGPNTGGMGAYAPAPVVGDILYEFINKRIFKPVIKGLANNGIIYKGILYAGLMIDFTGPKVLEFNVRFGDPEAQCILPLLKSDLYELCQATVKGKLEGQPMEFEEGCCICVVMASGGYPANYTTGYPITGLKEAGKLPEVVVFHAGTKLAKGKTVTSGGRVLGVTAKGENLEQAQERAYQAVKKINFEGAYYRSDIGYKGLARYQGLDDQEKQ